MFGKSQYRHAGIRVMLCGQRMCLSTLTTAVPQIETCLLSTPRSIAFC